MLDESLTVEKASKVYLADCLAREYSLRTVEGKESGLQFFLKWCLSNNVRRLAEVKAHHLEAYRLRVREYIIPRTQQALSVASRRARLTTVKVFLRRMFELYYLDEDITQRFVLPRIPRRLPKGFLTKDEVEAIFNQTTLFGLIGLRDRAILEVYYATGMRRAELGRLHLIDIDFKNRLLRIEQGKGKKDRMTPIAKRACFWVESYITKVRSRLSSLASPTNLFLNNKGEAFKNGQLSELVGNYVRRAGVDKRGACILYRHTTATAMLNNGADIRIIQEQLGHADISTTQIYTQVTIKNLREMYEKTHPAALNNQVKDIEKY